MMVRANAPSWTLEKISLNHCKKISMYLENGKTFLRAFLNQLILWLPFHSREHTEASKSIKVKKKGSRAK